MSRQLAFIFQNVLQANFEWIADLAVVIAVYSAVFVLRLKHCEGAEEGKLPCQTGRQSRNSHGSNVEIANWDCPRISFRNN